MQIKNDTPFVFGTIVTSRKPPRPEMVLVVRGLFALRPNARLAAAPDQGSLTADVFAPNDDDRRGQCLYPSDFGDFKLNAEVMLKGSCHPPGTRPVIECPVRFSVGAWSKTLQVIGARAWSDRLPGAVASAPLGFRRMPLDYAHAFGGPSFAANPAGTGLDNDALPNVEPMDDPIRSRRDRPKPAGFGPLNPSWNERALKVGKQYGRSYQATRAPYYAEDFDWTYFHAAPSDQQIVGYLRGDETIVLQNLVAKEPRLSAELPGLRIRAFAKSVDTRVAELRMNLDTLFVDADAGTVALTWRGLHGVREDDLTDIVTLLIASEPLGAPVAEDVYRRRLEAFEADPIGLDRALPKGMPDASELPAAAPGDASLDPVSKAFRGHLASEDQKQIQSAMKSVADAGVDMSAFGDGSAPAESAPQLVSLKPGAMSSIGLTSILQKVASEAAKAANQAALAGQKVEGLDELSRLMNDPELKALDPRYKPPRLDGAPLDEPGPGKDLSGQDLTDRDLRGCDLRGANLEDAILTRANLRGADLSGAKLAYSVLYKADLSDANLSGADLTMAQAAKARAPGANFNGANLEQTSFEEADLGGASFVEAKGDYVQFTRANLARVKAKACRLARSTFEGACLEGADFSAAVLQACIFVEAKAAGISLVDAKLDGSSLKAAELGGARLVRVRAAGTVWIDAKLDDADLRGAWIPRGNFTRASALRASFAEANLREANFYRARMDRASFAQSNLFSADLRKTRIPGVSFAGASLYGAKLLGASGGNCNLEGANLKRSTLEGRQ